MSEGKRARERWREIEIESAREREREKERVRERERINFKLDWQYNIHQFRLDYKIYQDNSGDDRTYFLKILNLKLSL